MKPDAFEKVMKLASVELRDAKDLLTSIGLTAQGNAQRLTPVATGTLRRSITNRVEGNAVYIGTAVEYAPFVEYGTRFMPARSYLGQGIEDSRDAIERLAAEFGGKLFEKVGRG